MSDSSTKIVVFGAGAIGCYVGGVLASGGANVTLVVRERIAGELREGLRVTDLDGRDQRVAVTTALDASCARAAHIVLVTVKSAQTAEAGRALRDHVAKNAYVISLQNGVRNAEVLRAELPDRRVLAGMVPFNVIRRAAGEYHRASEGTLHVDRGCYAFLFACRAAKLAVQEDADMTAVQWAKLVMNLNNAVNALSGRPLAEELSTRAYRRVLAAAQREALSLLDSAKQPIARLTMIPPRWMPRLLELPDAIFLRAAKRIIAIDPTARSSMLDDLDAKRPTEIDYINGEVVALASRLGAKAPINEKLVDLVRSAESGGKRAWSGEDLLRAIE